MTGPDPTGADSGSKTPGSTSRVDVVGGSLELHRWGPPDDAPVILAVHGITVNALSFGALAGRLADEVTLLAPDLRGRAGSAATVQPAGIAQHAADMIAVLNQQGVERAVLVGHSMGGYVATLVAARHPDRFSHVVVADGGVAFPPPPGTDVDALLAALLGPALDRLAMTFATPDDYIGFFRRHPALADSFNGPAAATLDAYLRHDLVPDGAGGFRSGCAIDVIRADNTAVLFDTDVHAAIRALPMPATLILAEGGMLGVPPGMIPPEAVAAADLPPSVTVTRVPGTNHYTLLLQDPGLAVVAGAVRDAVAA